MGISNLNIMVIDDMTSMRKVVMKVCKELGVESISEAGNGKDAWDALSASAAPFHLIISDWNMPVMTGLELLKNVKGDAKFKNTLFIMITAESEASQLAEASALGVNEYIVKPFTVPALKERLSAIFEKLGSAAAA